MPGDSANKRTKHQKLADLEQLNQWTLQGFTLRQCREKLAAIRPYTLSIVQIKFDLDKVRDQWKESRNASRNAHVERELARIDELERTYWTAYQRSIENAETTTKRVKEGGQSRQYDASTRVEERDGNPAFLAGVERCIQMRCKLLGLEAPQKQELSGGLKIEIVREDDNDASG